MQVTAVTTRRTGFPKRPPRQQFLSPTPGNVYVFTISVRSYSRNDAAVHYAGANGLLDARQ